MSDWRSVAVAALAASLPADSGHLAGLLREAVERLDTLLADRPPEAVATVAVPVAVHRALTGRLPPAGHLAAAAATYAALAVLDDLVDGDHPTIWADRDAAEVMIGVQVLLVTAAQVVGDGVHAPLAVTLTRTYSRTIATVSDGQLRSGTPLSASTTPVEVHARITDRSGALLAGFAELAATAAGASPAQIGSARGFGLELGIARQHVNDISELVSERTSDLRNRTATMATAFALARSAPDERESMLTLLHEAADDPQARDRLVLGLSPSIREVAALTALHLARARAHARLLSADDLRQDDLDRLVDFTAAALRRR